MHPAAVTARIKKLGVGRQQLRNTRLKFGVEMSTKTLVIQIRTSAAV